MKHDWRFSSLAIVLLLQLECSWAIHVYQNNEYEVSDIDKRLDIPHPVVTVSQFHHGHQRGHHRHGVKRHHITTVVDTPTQPNGGLLFRRQEVPVPEGLSTPQHHNRHSHQRHTRGFKHHHKPHAEPGKENEFVFALPIEPSTEVLYKKSEIPTIAAYKKSNVAAEERNSDALASEKEVARHEIGFAEDLESLTDLVRKAEKNIEQSRSSIAAKQHPGQKRQEIIHALDEGKAKSEPEDDIEALGRRMDETGHEIKDAKYEQTPITDKHAAAATRYIISKIQEIQDKLFKRTGNKELEDKLNQMAQGDKSKKKESAAITLIQNMTTVATTPTNSSPIVNNTVSKAKTQTAERRKIIPEEVVDKILEKFQQLKKEAKHMAVSKSRHSVEHAAPLPAPQIIAQVAVHKDVIPTPDTRKKRDEIELGDLKLPLAVLSNDGPLGSTRQESKMFVRNGEKLEALNTSSTQPTQWSREKPPALPAAATGLPTPVAFANLNTSAGLAIELLPEVGERFHLLYVNGDKRSEPMDITPTNKEEDGTFLNKVFSVLNKNQPAAQNICLIPKPDCPQKIPSGESVQKEREDGDDDTIVAKQLISRYSKLPRGLEDVLGEEKNPGNSFLSDSEMYNLPEGIKQQLDYKAEHEVLGEEKRKDYGGGGDEGDEEDKEASEIKSSARSPFDRLKGKDIADEAIREAQSELKGITDNNLMNTEEIEKEKSYSANHDNKEESEDGLGGREKEKDLKDSDEVNYVHSKEDLDLHPKQDEAETKGGTIKAENYITDAEQHEGQSTLNSESLPLPTDANSQPVSLSDHTLSMALKNPTPPHDIHIDKATPHPLNFDGSSKEQSNKLDLPIEKHLKTGNELQSSASSSPHKDLISKDMFADKLRQSTPQLSPYQISLMSQALSKILEMNSKKEDKGISSMIATTAKENPLHDLGKTLREEHQPQMMQPASLISGTRTSNDISNLLAMFSNQDDFHTRKNSNADVTKSVPNMFTTGSKNDDRGISNKVASGEKDENNLSSILKSMGDQNSLSLKNDKEVSDFGGNIPSKRLTPIPQIPNTMTNQDIPPMDYIHPIEPPSSPLSNPSSTVDQSTPKQRVGNPSLNNQGLKNVQQIYEDALNPQLAQMFSKFLSSLLSQNSPSLHKDLASAYNSPSINSASANILKSKEDIQQLLPSLNEERQTLNRDLVSPNIPSVISVGNIPPHVQQGIQGTAGNADLLLETPLPHLNNLHDGSSEAVIQQSGFDEFQSRTPEDIQFNWENQHPAIPQESLQLLVNKPMGTDKVLDPGDIVDKIVPKLAALLRKPAEPSINSDRDTRSSENSGKKNHYADRKNDDNRTYNTNNNNNNDNDSRNNNNSNRNNNNNSSRNNKDNNSNNNNSNNNNNNNNNKNSENNYNKNNDDENNDNKFIERNNNIKRDRHNLNDRNHNDEDDNEENYNVNHRHGKNRRKHIDEDEYNNEKVEEYITKKPGRWKKNYHGNADDDNDDDNGINDDDGDDRMNTRTGDNSKIVSNDKGYRRNHNIGRVIKDVENESNVYKKINRHQNIKETNIISRNIKGNFIQPSNTGNNNNNNNNNIINNNSNINNNNMDKNNKDSILVTQPSDTTFIGSNVPGTVKVPDAKVPQTSPDQLLEYAKAMQLSTLPAAPNAPGIGADGEPALDPDILNMELKQFQKGAQNHSDHITKGKSEMSLTNPDMLLEFANRKSLMEKFVSTSSSQNVDEAEMEFKRLKQMQDTMGSTHTDVSIPGHVTAATFVNPVKEGIIADPVLQTFGQQKSEQTPKPKKLTDSDVQNRNDVHPGHEQKGGILVGDQFDSDKIFNEGDSSVVLQHMDDKVFDAKDKDLSSIADVRSRAADTMFSSLPVQTDLPSVRHISTSDVKEESRTPEQPSQQLKESDYHLDMDMQNAPASLRPVVTSSKNPTINPPAVAEPSTTKKAENSKVAEDVTKEMRDNKAAVKTKPSNEDIVSKEKLLPDKSKPANTRNIKLPPSFNTDEDIVKENHQIVTNRDDHSEHAYMDSIETGIAERILRDEKAHDKKFLGTDKFSIGDTILDNEVAHIKKLLGKDEELPDKSGRYQEYSDTYSHVKSVKPTKNMKLGHQPNAKEKVEKRYEEDNSKVADKKSSKIEKSKVDSDDEDEEESDDVVPQSKQQRTYFDKSEKLAKITGDKELRPHKDGSDTPDESDEEDDLANLGEEEEKKKEDEERNLYNEYTGKFETTTLSGSIEKKGHLRRAEKKDWKEDDISNSHGLFLSNFDSEPKKTIKVKNHQNDLPQGKGKTNEEAQSDLVKKEVSEYDINDSDVNIANMKMLKDSEENERISNADDNDQSGVETKKKEGKSVTTKERENSSSQDYESNFWENMYGDINVR